MTILGIEKSLQRKPAQYSITHAVVRTSEIAAGTTQITNLSLHNGQIPRLIVLTTVASNVFNGTIEGSPFNFSWEKCLEAQIEVNGKLYPYLPYEPHTSPIEPYLTSLRLARKLFTDSDTGVTLDDFLPEGYQILAFDLNTEEGNVLPKTNGLVTFSGKWGPTDFITPTTLIYYMVWDNTISIDARKNIILDYIP